ncbi:glycosyltransferase family 2 protein [Arthrobacter psychrochitiniphilus]|uniref:Glycosyltransferase 2-like domain-containing protein n=1 Tax=Arthrobacter psychrochitiniphilus TaxID=291045 RepID=A0A2V3E239_9MICC|nr:glycosyltransferase family 2 protein [Arthrobacter psychrochitiniphilus]NYG16587.1 glycosyltransferase involved in cell wall biosynthesis [Arthrobacter psychrochitiniphilus]PXA69294.1 hypothetical protein CVS29_01620 [Arthrobacter psychrochitiniphilus]
MKPFTLSSKPISVQNPSKSDKIVSVIIPTIGRNELSRAILSARNQKTVYQIEIIVVIDLAQSQITSETLNVLSDADVVVCTGGNSRGGGARNIGMSYANGDWLAYLDDDDYWTEDKIEKQMDLATEILKKGLLPVIGCRVNLHYPKSKTFTEHTPVSLIQAGQPIWEYLFHKRRPGAGRSSFATSTMLLPMELARSIEWDTELKRHQDWDYLLRLSALDGVFFQQIEDSVVVYDVGSQGSISSSSDWKSSLDWAQAALVETSPKTLAEFLSAQTLRYAFQARSLTGFISTCLALIRNRRLPSLQSSLIGFSGIIGRGTLERIMSVLK